MLELAQRLRRDGVDAWIDRFEPAPVQGWPRWMRDQIEQADFVVLVCTSTYRRRFEGREAPGQGRGATWEGMLATQLLYDGVLDLERLVPVIFEGVGDEVVPTALRGATRHTLNRDYPQLLGRLTRSLAVIPIALGEVPTRAGMDRAPSVADELAMLHEQLKRQTLVGADTSGVLASIVEARRQLRDGPNLVQGEIVDGRYTLIEPLGKGGFASVWRAWDDDRRGQVAVKVLHAQWSEDRSRIDRFYRGAEALARLHHDGLVPILERPREDEHHHFFVMPWFAGGDLLHAISSGMIQRDAALRAVADAIAGLGHAHAQGLVHRDIKPSNILLDAQQRGRLADFDLVRGVDTTAGTRPGAGMGTFAYAAPEQLEDAGTADLRADVYGVGMCVLFVLLGRDPPPLVARTQPELLDQLKCTKALRDAIRGAVAYDHNERASSCAQLLEAMRCEVGESEAATASSASRRGWGSRNMMSARRVEGSAWPRWRGVVRIAAPTGAVVVGVIATAMPFRSCEWTQGEADVGNLESVNNALAAAGPIAKEFVEAPPAGARAGVGAGLVPVEPDVVLDACDFTIPAHAPEGVVGAMDDAPIGRACGVVETALTDTGAPMRLIGLTGGEFTMGSPKLEGKRYHKDERQHRVAVSRFAICETEVSLRQWEIVMGQRPNDCTYGCNDDHPVQRVNWNDAIEFLNALTRYENKFRDASEQLTPCYDDDTRAWDRSCTGYRLPTEMEWEFAARAGSTTAYAFGDDSKQICSYANVGGTACDDGKGRRTLAPVKVETLRANEWGLHAMHGNVWEWVFDRYDARVADGIGPTTETRADGQADRGRVLRGGSFVDWAGLARSAYRNTHQPQDRYPSFGLRCARGPLPQP